MTRSDLIAKLAERYPQLLGKDAELAVKVILGQHVGDLVARRPYRDSWLWQFCFELSSAASGA